MYVMGILWYREWFRNFVVPTLFFPTLDRETNYFGQKLFFPFTYAADCKRQTTTSTANLRGTGINFSSTGGGFN